MITHEGFVFMTPTGDFIRRVPVSTNTKDGCAFVHTNLSGATLFPYEKVPNDSKLQDWSKVTLGRDNLIVMKAVTQQIMRLVP